MSSEIPIAQNLLESRAIPTEWKNSFYNFPLEERFIRFRTTARRAAGTQSDPADVRFGNDDVGADRGVGRSMGAPVAAHTL
jgi:hypothetical protein